MSADACLVCLSDDNRTDLTDDQLKDLLAFAPCLEVSKLWMASCKLCRRCYENLQQIIRFKETCNRSVAALLSQVIPDDKKLLKNLEKARLQLINWQQSEHGNDSHFTDILHRDPLKVENSSDSDDDVSIAKRFATDPETVIKSEISIEDMEISTDSMTQNLLVYHENETDDGDTFPNDRLSETNETNQVEFTQALSTKSAVKKTNNIKEMKTPMENENVVSTLVHRLVGDFREGSNRSRSPSADREERLNECTHANALVELRVHGKNDWKRFLDNSKRIATGDILNKHKKWTRYKKPHVKKVSNSKLESDEFSCLVSRNLSQEEQVEELENLKNSSEFTAATFKCEDCGAIFSCEANIEEHRLKHESAYGKHCCAICKLRFSNEDDLVQHLHWHRDRYVCKLCWNAIGSKSSVLAHVRAHHKQDDATWKCEDCSMTYNELIKLICHLRSAHRSNATRKQQSGLNDKISVQMGAKLPGPAKPFQCDVCLKCFTHKSDLKVHSNRHKERTFKCEFCSKAFFIKCDLRKHAENAHSKSKDFYCVTCDKLYATKQSLKNHFKYGVKHAKPEDYKYTCEVCSKACFTFGSLNKHKTRVHGKEPFKCDACDKTFTTDYNMRKHRSVKHEGNAPPKDYMCDMCGKSFTCIGLLNIHMNSHNDKLPYPCKYCSKKFKKSTCLDAHIKNAHTIVHTSFGAESKVGMGTDPSLSLSNFK